MLNDADDAFLATLPVPVAPAEPRYLEEPRDKWPAQPTHVVRPTSTEQVAAIVRACATARVGLVPYGGGTGLVAGQVHPNGPRALILSLERMRAIRDTYPLEATLVAEAGATLAELHAAAEGVNRLFPLTYASKDSASIGGALAVNSGGLNVVRYGMARNLCLGVEAVLPSGEVFHGLKRLRKDNTGYDLRHLLIGSEGTLGIITAAALALSPRPAEVATGFLAVADPTKALELLSLAQDHAGEAVTAFELMSGVGFDFLAETYPDVRLPFSCDWSVLIELGTGPGTSAEGVMMSLVENAMERGLILDGNIAQSGAQRDAFWAVRETIPLANKRIGAIASHDISLPLSEIPAFVEEANAAVTAIAPVRINAFGHLGDGNLHYNAFPPDGRTREEFGNTAEAITRTIHDITVARGGSFSAEHGVGRAKVADLARYTDPAKHSAMLAIKQALDPLGIMNPGAVLDMNTA